MLLPESKREAALVFGERIRQIVASAPVVVEKAEIPVTVSVGIATTTGDEDISPQDLIAKADAMLYEAKNAGRNKVVG